MQESIRFPRCKHHQAYLELIFGFWLKVTLCRFMCDKNRIKTGTCHFNHDISGSNSAFDFLTFMHNAAQEKKWNKIKNRVNQLSMYVSTKIRCIALRYRFFLFNNNHKAQANDVVCLRHFIYVNYFRTNKMVFRFVDLFTCSRQNIDMLVCCACAIRWMEQKNSDGCNAKIPMQKLHMIWSILSAESFVRLQAVTIIGLLFNGKYTKVVIFFLLRRFVVFKKNIQFFSVAVLMNWGKNVWHKSSIGSIWIVNFLF